MEEREPIAVRGTFETTSVFRAALLVDEAKKEASIDIRTDVWTYFCGRPFINKNSLGTIWTIKVATNDKARIIVDDFTLTGINPKNQKILPVPVTNRKQKPVVCVDKVELVPD